jgi:hypothetical protein
MNLLSRESNCRFMRQTVLGILVLLASHMCQSAGQATTSRSSASDRIQAHFAAVQQAQQRNDYATAELEYQTVLVDAPDFANQSNPTADEHSDLQSTNRTQAWRAARIH